jgi:hypothetical protein
MLTSRRRFTAIALAASLVVATPLLAGCGLIPHPGGGGGISLPGVSVGTGHLPKDWPSGVPVAKGDVVAGASLGGSDKGHVWNATIKVGGADAGDGIATQLTGAGFTSGGVGGSTEQGSTATYAKDHYTVLVLVTKDNKQGWIANYTVTYDPKSDSSGG